MSRSPILLRKVIFSICMMPSLASRHVLSVSACCASCRGKSGTRSWNGPWPGTRGGGCVGGVWLSREADARNTATTAAESDALMPRILHRPSSIGGALVRAREPLAQLPRRVDRRRAVERHQRRRSTGQADDVRAPAILLHRGDLDEIWTSPDGLFKAMDGGVHGVGEKLDWWSDAHCTDSCAANKRSEGRKRAHNPRRNRFSTAAGAKKICVLSRCTGNPPVIHRFCTGGHLDCLKMAHYA